MEEKIEIHQNHSGIGDNVGRDKITNIYLNTKDYQELENHLKNLQEQKSKLQKKNEQYPDDEDFKADLLKVDGLIEVHEKKIESFKADVSRLYETFTKIEINTERLRLAKGHFDQGEFREADAVLKAAEISREVKELKESKDKKERELTEINEHLESKANEFLVKAQLWKTFYSEPNWYIETCKYYGNALDASRSVEIVFEFAHFLQEHNQYNQAQPLYEEALQIYRSLAQENPAAYLPDVAMTLNNLANLQKDKNEFGSAQEKYEEALQIYRALAQENPAAYLPDVAMTLNNLANLQKAKNEFGSAQEKYEEALQIRRSLAQENPAAYLPDVATTLNNLAILHSDKNEFGSAQEKYEEALQIYRSLAQENPAAYLPNVAMTVINLSIFYLQSLPDQEKSIALAVEAVELLLPVYEQIPYLENYLKTALQVLQANGVDVEKLTNGG
jgi:hypothetical protein